MLPDDTAKYPLAQRCLPNNCFLRWVNSCNSILEFIPFTYCMILLTVWVGLQFMNMYILSLATFPEIMFSSCSMAICLVKSLALAATCPYNILFFRILLSPNQVRFQVSFCVRSHAICSHEWVLTYFAWRDSNHPRMGHWCFSWRSSLNMDKLLLIVGCRKSVLFFAIL